MHEKEMCEQTMKQWGECLARFRNALRKCDEAMALQWSGQDLSGLRDKINTQFLAVKHGKMRF